MKAASIYKDIVRCLSALTIILLLVLGRVFAQSQPVVSLYALPGTAEYVNVGDTYWEITNCRSGDAGWNVEFDIVDFDAGYDASYFVFDLVSVMGGPSSGIQLGERSCMVTTAAPAGAYELEINIVGSTNHPSPGATIKSIKVVLIKAATPSPVVVASALEACDGESIFISSVEDNVTYTWYNGGTIIANVTEKEIEVNKDGNYRVRVDRYGCFKMTPVADAAKVKFNSNPEVSVGSNGDVCYDGQISLTSNVIQGGTSPFQYEWTTTSPVPIDGASINNHAITIDNATVSHSGDYTMTVTDSKNCKGKATTTVKVHDEVNPGSISGDDRICQGTAPKEIISTSPASGGDGTTTYLWEQSIDGGTTWSVAVGTNNELTYTPPADLSVTTQYRRRAINSCDDTKFTNPVTVTVDTKVVVSILGTYSTCPGVAKQLNGSISGGVSTGTWSVDPTLGSFDDPTKLNAIFTPEAGVANTDITLKLTSDKPAAPSVCPVVDGTVVVKVHPKGKATYTFPLDVCTSAPEFLLTMDPAGGTYNPNTYNDVMPFKPSDFNNGDTYQFTYDGVTDANGCVVVEDVTISITSPQKFTITAPDVKYCANGKGVTIKVDGSESGVTYELWENGATTGRTYTGDGNAFTFDNVKGDGSKFTVRATRNGCYIDMNGDVTLQEIPEIQNNTISSTENSICKGGDIVLTGTQPTGGEGSYTYLWQKSEDGGATWQDIGTTKDIGTIAVGAETQFRRFVYSGLCELLSTDITVTVTTPINPGELNPVAEPVCNGATVAITNKTDASINNYQWEISDDGSTYAPIAGATEKDLTNCPPLTVDKYYFRRMSSDGPGGCPDARTNVIEVNVLKPLSVSLTGTPPDCNGYDGTLLAAVVGGKADYHYSWYQDGNPLSLPDQASVLTKAADKYTVTVHDGCGDNATSIEYNLTQPTAIKGSISSVTNILGCYADKTGEFTITVSGGTAPYTLTWGSDVQTGVTSTHTYTGQPFVANGKVQIVDNKSCPGESDDVNITQPDLVEISLVGKQAPSCNNDDGHIEVKGTGGTGPGTYTFTLGTDVRTNATQEIFGTLGYGDYTIYIEDANGCPATNNYIKENLPEPTPVTLEAEGLPVTDCPGTPTGGIKLTISGGTGTYEYYSPELGGTWEPVTGNITGQPKGTYYIKVRDVNTHCESPEKEAKIEEPNALDFTATPNSVLCHNSTDGEIVISDVKGGAGSGYKFTIAGAKTTNVHDGTVEYAWPDDFHGSKFENLEPDTYTLTLSDGVCNSLPQVHTIGAPNPINISLDEKLDIQCWKQPLEGTVKFSVDDGGTGTLRYYITEPGNKSKIFKSGVINRNGSVSENLGVGFYDIVVIDENDCGSNIIPDVEIVLGNRFRWKDGGVNVTYTDVTCAELNDGTASHEVVFGTGEYYYELIPHGVHGVTKRRIPDSGTTTAMSVTFTNLPKGEYSLRAYSVGLPDDCPQETHSFTIGGPDSVKADIDKFDDIRCHGENATLTVSAKGGSGEYDIDLYSLSMGYETTIHVVGSEPAVFPLSREDEYYTRIKDTKGCGDYETKHYTVHNPQPVSFDAKNDGNVTCNGGNNGVILISGLGGGNGELWYSVNGGDGVYIDPPHSDFTINVGKGEYKIKVYDGNNCESPIDPIKTVIIDEPKPLWIHSYFDNPLCSTTGDLNVEARGGNGTGTYEFSENGVDGWLPQDAFVWNNIGGGDYKIWLRDAFDHNCMIPWDTTVITPTALQIVKDLTIDVVPTCRQKGKLSVETVGGMSTVKYYLWREGETDYDQDNETGIFEVEFGGDYYVKIDDGCPPSPYTTGKVHIDAVPKVNIVNIHFDDIRCNGETTTVTVTADGSPTGKYFYTLLDKSVDPAVERSNGENNVFDDVKAGLSYYIVVADSEDGSGCVDTVPFAVDEAEKFMWSRIRAVPETSSGDANGFIHFKTKGGEYDYTVTFTPEGGSPTSYQVNDSTYLNVFDNLGSGVYTVKVKDNRGCPLDSTFILQGIDINYWMEHVSCNEKADGKVVAVVTGNPPYSLYLQDGNNPMITYTDYEIYSKSIINKELTGYRDTLIFSNIPAGDYDLIVGDINSRVPISRNAPILLPTLFEASKLDADEVPVCAMGGTGKVSFEVKGSNTLDAGGNEVKTHEGIIIRPTYVIKWVNTTTGESGQKESTTPGTITVDGLNPGVIEFIATTENGCNETPFMVDFPLINPITVDVSVMQESSYGAGNGLIEANVTSGGVPDFVYVLHTVGGGSTAPSPIGLFSNVARGKYVVEARDANCSGFSDTIEIRGTNFVIDSTHSVSCYGGSNGEFWFTLGFGFKPFEVKVTNSADEPVEVKVLLTDSTYYVKDVAAGEYTITVEDSLFREGKVKELNYTVVVDEAKEMILDVLVLASKCELGEAEYDFNGGGTPDYTYLYSMDATASYDAYTALAPGETKYAFEKAGEHYFVVKDASGCYSNQVTRVATQADIDFTIGVTDNHCPGGQNGVITVAISNIDNYSFSLYQGGSMINVSENGLFENLLADGGNFYGIEVTDKATLCSVRTPDTIRVNDGPAINLTVVGFSDDGSTLNCSYDTNGWIEAEATGGNGEFTYIWPDLGESTQRVDGLPAGDYTVIAVDSRDCPQSKTYTINGPAPFTFDPSVRVEAQCRKSTNASGLGGELHVSGSGATEPYTFTLVDETGHAATPSNNTGHFTGLGAGIYEVVVVDKKNCRYTMYDEILINPANDFDIGSMDTTVCFTNEVELKANMIFGDVYNDQYGLKYSWWSEANEGNITPDATGETYYVEGLDVNIYRYKLRVSQEGGPLCYVEKWFDVGVYPKLDIHVPLYVSTVQNDTILSILFNEEYNVDVSANNFDYNTQFEWFPKGVFVRENSWNTSIFMTPEKYAELKETYPNRFVIRRDPQTKRDGEFMLATVVGTTDVGCKDSLTLYTKIVNKLYLANVFSPNGDGRNDIWRIPKEYLFPDLEIEIFNRWGALVWSATGDRAARGWDGRSNNGKHLPIGTYWYVIKFNINSDDWKPLTGSVTIVK